MGYDDSDFQVPDEIREPDWSSDDSAPATDDDADFQPPSEIREPDWDS